MINKGTDMNDALIKAGMDKLFALAQEGKDDSARCGNYSMLIGFYEAVIRRYVRESDEVNLLTDLEAATKFF